MTAYYGCRNSSAPAPTEAFLLSGRAFETGPVRTHSATAFAAAQRAGSSARMTVLVDTAKILEAAESRTLTRIARGSCAALRQVSLQMRSGPAYEKETRYGARIRTTGFEKSTSLRSR